MALKRKAAGIFAAVVLMAGMLPTAALAAEVSDTTDSEDTTTVNVTETEEDTEDSAESGTVSTTADSETEEADETDEMDVETEVLTAILEILNTASEDSETTGTVTASALNVRCGAGMDYSVIDVIYRGDTVQVLGSDGSWYEITYDDVEGYVYSDYLTVTESSSGVSINLDSDSVSTLISLLYSSGDGDEESEALTPDGNLTLVDDYGSSTEAGKQYITLVTKSGNYFYLIIDRDDEGEETVHFLNLVDESDLLALMDEDEAAEYESADADDEDDADETAYEDADDTSTDDAEDAVDEEETEEKSSGGSNTLILLVLFIIGVCAVGLFLYKKIGGGKKPAKTNGPDPDEDDDEPGYNLPVEDDDPDEPDEE